MKLLLKNGHVVDPASKLNARRDVLIEDDTILAIEPTVGEVADRTIDLEGLYLCPGFIDMHVHLREPGQEWKETISSGTRAAARGGFTAVACMPNTIPVNDSRSVTELIVSQAAEHGVVHVHPIGCVSKRQEGVDLAEMEDMLTAGAVAFSDDGKPVLSSLLMRRALEYSKIFDVPIIDHCEDTVLVNGGVMNEGDVSTRLGLKGWPSVGEDVMVGRDVLLSDYTGGHVHIAHMSTARSTRFVRWAKKEGIAVTSEVTPHHFVLTDEAIGEYDTDAKMNPPLRGQADLDGLLEGLADGTVDAIATDHAPHHCDEKCVEFANAPFGVVGLETAVAISLDRLVHRGVIDLARMVELFTTGPAGVLRLDRGSLRVGGNADLTVLDIEKRTRVEVSEFASKSTNTPFKGWELRGAPVMTLVGGEVVHDGR